MTKIAYGVKVVNEATQGRIGGYLVVWGSASQRDLEGEYFTPDTYLGLEIYGTRPVMYHHGLDGDVKSSVIGIIDTLKTDDVGVWAEAQLDLRNKYVRHILKLIDRGIIQWSSGTLPQLVEVDANGKIVNWLICEGSLTPTPAEYRKTEVSVLKSAYKSLGLGLELFDNNIVLDRVTAKPANWQTDGYTISIKGISNMAVKKPKAPIIAKNKKPVVLPTPGNDEETGYLKSMLYDLDLLSDDATAEEVVAAQEAFKAIIGGKMEGAEVTIDEVPVKLDVASLLASLGLPEDATPDDVMAAIDEIFAMESGGSGDGMASADEDMTGKSIVIDFDYNRLSQQRARASKSAGVNRQPIVPKAHGSAASGKKSSIATVFQNRGAEKPGIKSMLQDLAQGKTISYNQGQTGGYILQHEVSDEWIPALRDALPLFDMGVDRYDMEGIETMTILKDSTEPDAYWVAEDIDAPESDEQVGGIMLVPKPLAVVIPIPNKFLTNSRINYEQRIREKITYAINRALMIAAIRGSGGVEGSNVGASPVGVLNLSGVTSSALGSGNGAKPTLKDLISMIGDLEDSNIEEDDSWGWLFNPRTKRTFTGMTDGDGLPILRENWGAGEDKSLLGIPYWTSNVVLRNRTVGTSTDCSNIYLGRWGSLALGLSDQVEFLVDPYSLSRKLQTQVIAHIYADIRSKYDQAFSIRTGVRP